MRKKIKWAFLAAMLVAVMTAALCGCSQPSAGGGEEPVESKQITIEVLYESGELESHPFQTQAEFLKEAAEEVLTLEGEETAYGFSVYGINGVTADFNTGNAYWALYVNGEYANYGVSELKVQDQDVYRFAWETY